MKLLLIFIILALGLSACNDTVEGFNELTEEEKENLRQRYSAQCLADSEERFDDIKTASDEQFDESSDTHFARNKAWTYELKLTPVPPATSTASETQKIIVWKTTPTAVYFIIKKDLNSVVYYRFLKISKTTNDLMFDDIKSKNCAKTVTLTLGSSSSTVEVETETAISSTESQLLTRTYTYPHSMLAYFSAFKETRKIEKLNEDRKVTSTTNYTGTLTVATSEVPTYDLYTDYPSDTQYCTVTNSAGPSYTIPYTEDCVTGFTPTELCYSGTDPDADECIFPDDN